MGNKRNRELVRKLGGTDSLISMRPKRYEKETGSLHCELGGTDSLISVGPKRYEKESGNLQSHLGETNLPRVCGSGYDI